MPIDQGDLERPLPRNIINPAAADLNVEPPGFKQEAGEFLQAKVGGPVIQLGAEAANKIDALSRRDFFKIVKLGLKIGFPVILALLAYTKREGIGVAIEYLASKFKIVEDKPVDQRITTAFGENYSVEAKTQAIGQYSLYLLGNNDAAFNLTNIPEQGEKENVVWYLTYEYGTTWPFASPERDQKTLDPTEDPAKRLFNVASRKTFIDRISADLELTVEQKGDLISRYDNLSSSSAAMVQWLTDLKNQGVEKITDEVIQFYTDPIKAITGLS